LRQSGDFKHLQRLGNCLDWSMNINSTSNSSESYIQSLLNNSTLAGVSLGTSGTAIGSTTAAGVSGDGSQLSPLAQLLSTLQQLQQQNPTQYQQVTAQIATNLQTAASTAQSDGNSTQASQLNQLATDFQNASQTGQLPNIQNLAQAIGGHHHHHHHGGGSGSETQNNSTQDSSQNPLSIIENTLSGATS
jgi:hypothetical protein